MKRVGNLWEQIIDINNIKRAFCKARIGKLKYADVRNINENLDHFAKELQNNLINNTLPKSCYRYEKINDNGKPRELSILPFYPFRILHWVIKNVINKHIDKTLIFHTCSGRVGKGTHKMIPYIAKAFRKYKWVLATDVRKYYDSINKRKLKFILYRHFKDKKLLKLMFKIIDEYKPELKVGIPLGNSISVDFSNLFLTDIDHKYISKSDIGYYRFMDNIFFFSNNRFELKELYFELKRDLIKYDLRLHRYILDTTEHGMTIVGYNYTSHQVKASDKLYKSLHKTQKRIRQREHQGKPLNYHYKTSLNSKLGFIKHNRTY